MPLVTSTEMFKKAYDGGYAIGAFNVNNMEIVQGITEAARDLEAPLILQVSKGARAYANHTYLVKLVEAAVKENPNLLVLHASSHRTSNTYELWKLVREGLQGIDITEIGLRNGTLSDCSGCPYSTCLHFGEQGSCFYGGVMVDDVYPAVRKADAVLLLCPNYNDALSANLTAFINRLTALFRTYRFYEKAVFALVVSGYSGSDIIAEQVISALNMNKTFFLPGQFAMMETANNAGEILTLPGIRERALTFSARVRDFLER